MFPLFRTKSAAVQLYGKLPIAKDYLRVGCSTGNARYLREWLDETFSTSVEGGAMPELAQPLRFLLDAGAGTPLQGTLWPSSDAGGERRFPFALFVEHNRRRLLADLQEGLPKSTWGWGQLESKKDESAQAADGQRFLSAMRRAQIPLHDAEPEQVPAIDAVSWSRALWAEEGPRGLVPLYEQLRRYHQEKRRDPIRLPLVSNLPMVVQAHAWLRLLTEASILTSSTVPNVFFPRAAAQAPAYLSVFPSTPTPADSRWLAVRTEGGAGPFDFASTSTAQAEAADSSEPHALADALLHAWSAS